MSKISLRSRKSIVFILALCLAFLLSSCFSYTMKKKVYYSQEDNYVNAMGTVTRIYYNDDYTALSFVFTELTPRFDGPTFKIVGDNLSIVEDRGINQKIKVGDRVEFITAPEYFGDGYVMPIVAISINGEELLTFDEGFPNLLKWLSKQ